MYFNNRHKLSILPNLLCSIQMSLMSLSVMSQSLMNSLSAMFSMKSTCLVLIFLLPGVLRMPTQDAGWGSSEKVGEVEEEGGEGKDEREEEEEESPLGGLAGGGGVLSRSDTESDRGTGAGVGSGGLK